MLGPALDIDIALDIAQDPATMSFHPARVPVDIVYAVLQQLSDRRDLHAATPLLYRTLDTDARTKGEYKLRQTEAFHPAVTILRKPSLARHVRHVREIGAMHRDPAMTAVVLKALSLCDNLYSFTWSDDMSSSPETFEAFLHVLKRIPFRSLTIRTYSDLGVRAWASLNALTGLHKVAIWCMEGPPRVLQGWADRLGGTLTELELGRCAGVPATILISVLSQLPLLRDLRLKGAPSASMHDILTCVPNLLALDTEYLGAGLLRPALDAHAPLPRLRHLTVRTSSVDLQGPRQLWQWLRQLIPRPSLESFTLNAFSTQGQMRIPRHFLLDLAHTQGTTLRTFLVNMSQLTHEDVACVCAKFPRLEALSCAVVSRDSASIEHVIAQAHQLRSLKLHVTWLPDSIALTTADWSNLPPAPRSPSNPFEKKDAEALMLRTSIRTLSMGPHMYIGKWIQEPDPGGEMRLKLLVEEVSDRWV
ncbi:hypothetical protein OF83DRAFT_1126093 [Amylostereum chailletii]|nr:hypothetical protein OF83DRAFT_1126093 [Amylostereum chailletii]